MNTAVLAIPVARSFWRPARDAALVALHLALALVLSARLNIWIDEYYTLNTTGSTLRHALHAAARLEAQPPLYFLLLTLWRALGDSILFIRLFSALCTSGVLLLLAPLSRRYLDGLDHGWLLLAAAINPFLLWAAVEIRLYAFCLLMSALLLLLFHRAFLSARPGWKSSATFGLAALAAVYSHYYLGILLVGFVLALLALRRFDSLKYYLLTMLGVSVLFLPMAWIVARQVLNLAEVTSHPYALPSNLTWVAGLKTVYLRIQEYLAAVDWLPWKGLRLTARLAFIGIGLGGLALGRRGIGLVQAALWMILGWLALVFFSLLVGASEYLALRRHTFVLFLPVLLGFFSLFALRPAFRRAFLWASVGLVTVVNAYALYAAYRPMAKTGDYARVAAYLQAHESADQPILTFNSESAMPLSFYYRGVNRIVPLPGPVNTESFREEGFVISNARQVASAINRASPSHQVAWYVRSGAGSNRGWSYNGEILEEYLEQHYTIQEVRRFYGCEVTRLARRRQPGSSP